MKFIRGKWAAATALGVVLGAGMVGQASATVYGLGYVDIYGLKVTFSPIAGGTGPGLFTFDTNADAALNGSVDPTSGAANCGDFFPGSAGCTVSPTSVPPVLSGTVQNAPPVGPALSVRSEDSYVKFGNAVGAGNYSNSEAGIIDAALLADPATKVQAISESNLVTASNAQATSSAGSNTTLNLLFTGGVGMLSIEFMADVDVRAEVTGGDIGLARASSSASFRLVQNGATLASWAPNGSFTADFCGGGLTCTIVDSSTSLNSTASSTGLPNSTAGLGGKYRIDVTGLSDGDFELALSTSTSTSLIRRQVVPVPGTLMLVGTGLLLGARAVRRRKS